MYRVKLKLHKQSIFFGSTFKNHLMTYFGMKTIFFVIFKFGHHTENSLTHLYGTGIVCMKDVILQTGYQMTPKSPVQSKTRTAQTTCTAHQITLLVIRDSKQ